MLHSLCFKDNHCADERRKKKGKKLTTIKDSEIITCKSFSNVIKLQKEFFVAFKKILFLFSSKIINVSVCFSDIVFILLKKLAVFPLFSFLILFYSINVLMLKTAAIAALFVLLFFFMYLIYIHLFFFFLLKDRGHK